MKKQFLLGLFTAFLLASCAADEVKYQYPERINGRYEMPTPYNESQSDGKLFGDGLTFKVGLDSLKSSDKPSATTEKQEKSPVLKQKQTDLWPAALNILSAYPIAIADKTGGLIATEWFSDSENAKKQIKINAVIGEKLKIDVLTRVLQKNGTWVNQKNNPTLAVKLENDILAKTQH